LDVVPLFPEPEDWLPSFELRSVDGDSSR
jgi:hypothetical protein